MPVAVARLSLPCWCLRYCVTASYSVRYCVTNQLHPSALWNSGNFVPTILFRSIRPPSFSGFLRSANVSTTTCCVLVQFVAYQCCVPRKATRRPVGAFLGVVDASVATTTENALQRQPCARSNFVLLRSPVGTKLVRVLLVCQWTVSGLCRCVTPKGW